MKRLTCLSAALVLAGCATVTRGTTQDFEIESEPPGATATLTTGQTCVTPCKLTLPRKTKFNVTVELDGYKKTTKEVKSQVAAAGAAGFLGNAIIGGIIGAAVDASNGATMELVPNPLKVTLEAEPPAPETEPAENQPPAAPLAEPTPQEPEAPAAPAPEEPPSGEGAPVPTS